MTDDLERLIDRIVDGVALSERVAKAVRERYTLTPKPAPDPLAVTAEDVTAIQASCWGDAKKMYHSYSLTRPELRALVVRVNKRVIEGLPVDLDRAEPPGETRRLGNNPSNTAYTKYLRRIFCGEEAP